MIHQYTEPFFHIGLVCKSIEHTADQFSTKFGVEFHEPEVFALPNVDDGELRSVSVRACFSIVGPPHIELFEADGRGIYSVEHDAEMHHIGLWVPNCAASLARAQNEGMAPAAVLSDSGMNVQYWFTNPKDTLGIRFEMIDDGDRHNLEVFIRTGRYPDGPMP